MRYKSLLLAILSSILVFTSCDKSSDLSNTIPADAKYVMYVDTKKLIEKSEYDIFQNQTIQRAINMGKAFLKDQDQIKLIDGFMKDANSLGLNLKNDLYVFTNYNVYGIVLGVNDAKKVKEVFIKSSIVGENDILEENGTYMFSPGTDLCVIWNKDKALLLTDISKQAYLENKESIDVVALAKEYLNQPADKSINSDKTYQEFFKNKKDVSAFYSMSGLDAVLESKGMWNYFPDMISLRKGFEDLEGVSVGAYNHFEKGEIRYSNKLFYTSEDAEKRFKGLLAQFTGNLKGDHLKYITEKPIFLSSVNLKGQGVFNYLLELGAFNLLTNEVDSTASNVVEQVMKGVNGDVTFALTSIHDFDLPEDHYEKTSRLAARSPQCVLFADVDNGQEVVNMITTQFKKDQTEYTEISPSVFAISPWDNVKIYFGVENNIFFATNDESVYNNLKASDLKNNYQEKIKGKSIFVTGNLQSLANYFSQTSPSNFPSSDIEVLKMFFDPMGEYNYAVAAEDFSGEGAIQFVNKEDNSLKTFCKQIDDFINKQASKLF
jgi:hypothetical protein